MPKLIQEQQKTAFQALKGDFKWSNVMQTPKVEKVVISVGVGKMAKDKGKVDLVANRLAKITGQKPASRGAKKSIATYKTRIGDKVGYQITLRGKRAEDYSLGIKEHIVFPETADEEIKDVFGMAATVVTTAKSKAEAKAYLTHLGFPFKK